MVLVRYEGGDLPSNKSFNSRLASLLSRRSCRSISWLMRFCSFASSDKQHSMLDSLLINSRLFCFTYFLTYVKNRFLFLFGPLFLYIYYVYNFFLSPFFLLFHIYLYFVSYFREKSLVYMTFSMKKCTMCFFFFFSQQIVTYFVTCILFYIFFCCIKKQFEHLSLSVCERLFFSLRLTLDKSPCKIVLWTRSMHPLHLWINWNFVFCCCCCCYFFRLINLCCKKIIYFTEDETITLSYDKMKNLFYLVSLFFFDAGKYTRGGANIAKITL